MAPLGTTVMAANTFMLRYMTLSFMPAFGIGIAVTALVGRYLGMGRLDLARQRADLGFKVAAFYMVICGIVFFVGRFRLIGLFSSDPQVLHFGAILLIYAAIYQFFDAMYIIYNGALRGAGDTFVPAVTTAGLCWGISVFGGWMIARSHPQWGPAGPWTIASVYGIILGFFMLVRFRRGQWKAIPQEELVAEGAKISRSSDGSDNLSLSLEGRGAEQM
jgi:MATE family multidrug resistance protein